MTQSRDFESRQPQTFLYARIMLWITLPLFFLGVFFTAIQLTQQLNTLNQVNRIQSEIAFSNIYKVLRPEFQKEANFTETAAFLTLFKNLKANYKIWDIDVFNILENKPLFPGSDSSWSREDIQMIEGMLSERSRNRPYQIRVNKQTKQLIAYMFFQGPASAESLFVTKAVFPLTDVKTALMASRKTLVMMFAMIMFIGLIISQGLASSILRPIRILDKATREIMRGELGRHISIKTGDEIEALARTFNQMSDALEEMKRKAQDSNPLTGLPGNTGIFHNLEKRIVERQKFIMFHCDLDRFKVFNDQFGLAQGDKAIKATADMLKKAVKEKGGADDFVGHQGGDDFVLITRPQRAAELAAYVCDTFKSTVVSQLYPREDFKNGYTLQLDRRRQTETGETVMVPFPLISITLAGISNAKRDFADYADCMARVAPVKKDAKKIADSNFVIQE